MIKLFILLFSLVNFIVARNPFSYGITEKIEYLGFGKTGDNICGLIDIDGEKKYVKAQSNLGKYYISEITDKFIVIEDKYDNKLKVQRK